MAERFLHIAHFKYPVCVCRYGMCEFVVISPGANWEAVISESKCNLLLSSVSISLANTGCQVPMFVQVQQKWRRMYHGECQGPGARTDLEMVHLRKVPRQYNHLSGLLDIFKSKTVCPLSPRPPINIAIRFTYVLQDWQQYSWPQLPPDFDGLLRGEVGGVEFGKLQFGACEDPISELHLLTTWPHPTEGIMVDNDAPHLSVRVRSTDNPTCLLGDFLTEFFRLCSKKESEEILGRGPFEEEGNTTSALSKLTEPTAVPIPKLSVSNMVNDVLNSILLYLFPDAATGKQSSENSERKAAPSHTDGEPEEKDSDDYSLYNQPKSAPSNSVAYLLALCLVNFYLGGVRAVAHLWQKFVLGMRYRWENNDLVYGLVGGPPHLLCCLLHQKLQENGERREKEGEKSVRVENGCLGPESAATVVGAIEVSPGKSRDTWSYSESEDEFFECLRDTELVKDGPSTDDKKGGAKEDGEPAPMTEDLLEEQSEVLAKLGTSATACLLSDMESFKAANPGCTLEDFVRWYSPRDYFEEEVVDESGDTVVRGDLSARMKIPGNMWMEPWATAKTTPARRRGCLFDDTKEAEKVLHYLAVQKPADLTCHPLPCILHTAILKEKEDEKAIQQATSHAGKLLRHPSPDYKKLEDVISQLIAVEMVIARSRSLKSKFGIGKAEPGKDAENLERFVRSLLEEPEVSVIRAGCGPASSIIHKLFVSAQRVKHTVTTTQGNRQTHTVSHRDPAAYMCPRPPPYSKALPQRLICVLMRDEFRLVGAFSSDTSFF
uniref:Rab3 GTPase-activating protein catalytic subunit n=1 Tax=Oncorhynchus mykiss TaxID=8022 RepID=A0A8C7RH60_ONCMY